MDDVLITGDDLASVHKLKQHLDHTFSIKNLGKFHFFQGIKVTYTEAGIILTQYMFTKELLVETDLDLRKPTVTPLPMYHKLLYHTPDDLIFPNPILYRILVGKLNFLTNTRPDLSYTV